MKDAADQFYRETTNENKEFIKSKIWIFNNFFYTTLLEVPLWIGHSTLSMKGYTWNCAYSPFE